MNTNLHKAKKAKNDEFYTQYEDIEKELSHYTGHFKDKVVYCNCDDPKFSNFWKYFVDNFERLRLKKLIATYYKEGEAVYKSEYFGANNPTIKTELLYDGDFRSRECIDILKEADVVVTNPPFSLFREYVGQLMEYGKKFLIIGNQNAITYKEIFPLIKDNKMWKGINHVKEFIQPDDSVKKFGNISWFTNLDIDKRHDKIALTRYYTPEEYPKYDNYDAIEVGKTKDIPMDYDGVMGVPISFLDHYNEDQFEIVGITSGREEFSKEASPIKRYIKPLQHNLNGTIINGSKANTRATLQIREKADGIYYTAENSNIKLSIVYARILIRRK